MFTLNNTLDFPVSSDPYLKLVLNQKQNVQFLGKVTFIFISHFIRIMRERKKNLKTPSIIYYHGIHKYLVKNDKTFMAIQLAFFRIRFSPLAGLPMLLMIVHVAYGAIKLKLIISSCCSEMDKTGSEMFKIKPDERRVLCSLLTSSW